MKGEYTMKTLVNKMNRIQMRAVSAFTKFMKSERGDTNFISIIIIAIVIALAGIFWAFAKNGMSTISSKFTKFINGLG